MNDASAMPAARGDWCSPGRFALVLAVLIFASFWDVLLGVDTFAVRDFGLFSFPVATFYRECFWKGQIPWWNPLSCCGLPFLAQFNTLTLYPFSLIYLLLPLTWSLPFFCLLHLFIGGMGMYFLAFRWTGSRAGAAVAGVVFAFNGLSLNFLMWPSHIATFAWMPWVILLTENGWKAGGRKLVPAALAAALQVLAGGPEEILFTWLILLAIAVVVCAKGMIRPFVLARRFLLAGALAFCLAAAQLLPFIDFALHCSRTSHYAASEWSMPAWGWANFLMPMFQTWRWLDMSVQVNQYWTSSYYVGIGVVFLAALALWRGRSWRVWLLGGIVAASMILALGDHGFVYLWLRKTLPFLGFFRFPIKFVIITSLLFPVLAAFAVSQYEEMPGRKWRPELSCAGAIALLMGMMIWFARQHPLAGTLWSDALNNGLSRLGFLAAFIGALYFFVKHPAQRRWSALLLTVVAWLDIVTAMPWQNPTLNASVYQPGLGQMAAKLNPVPDPAQSRLMISTYSASQVHNHPAADLNKTYLLERSVFLSDCNLLDDFPKVDGFFSLYLRDTDRILWLLDAHTGAELDHLEDFLAVSQTVAPGSIYNWIPRTNYVPIVSIGQGPVFADAETAFKAINQTNVDFRKAVYLPPEAKAQVTAKRESEARIVSKQFSPNKNTIQVQTPNPAMVIVSQAYYHNWQAQVDGKPVPLWRANYAFQAVEVPAGTHTVTLLYRDRLFWFGTVLAGVAALVCAAFWALFPGQEEPAYA